MPPAIKLDVACDDVNVNAIVESLDVSPSLTSVAVIVIVGAVVSTTKLVKVRLLAFPDASVTVTVLLAYVPSPKVLKVTVLLPVAAEALVENPSVIFVVIVPASLVVNT